MCGLCLGQAGPRIGWSSAAGRAGIHADQFTYSEARARETTRRGRKTGLSAAFKFKLVGEVYGTRPAEPRALCKLTLAAGQRHQPANIIALKILFLVSNFCIDVDLLCQPMHQWKVKDRSTYCTVWLLIYFKFRKTIFLGQPFTNPKTPKAILPSSSSS